MREFVLIQEVGSREVYIGEPSRINREEKEMRGRGGKERKDKIREPGLELKLD